ncbi:LacI family DNA-binding transcriptional regulator [Bacillus sp. V2I10]|uniref:LacI family DNA-binding transcriptional regulator n=1 Tax=Bacillus sp. V2I10 TaxID=3042276 RepID=UPI0027899831|nr:LacI family DNA-binding transcriptional regulator [Bacillus sp. V2I10]MDQ0861896.1 LacI family repressor for deo operon, udp, cdd, tsx, nupC, and nupG [Bacillus sp. V2I10]
MTKMSDVAKLANVSTATVSRVLRNPETVKKKTQQKVFEAIKQLDYQPNILARHFRTNQTKTILVVVPSLTNLVFSEIISGIDTVATEKGYQVLLGNTNRTTEKAQEFINHLKQKQVDGAILLTVRLEQTLWEEIAHHYPIVLASDFIGELNIPTVCIDNIKYGYQMTEHLIKLGHRKIAHVSGSSDVSVSRERVKGYRNALRHYNIPFDKTLMIEGDYSIEWGYSSLKKLMKQEVKPTAIFFGNDEMAMGGIKAAQDIGIRVPEDLAVTGFDDIKFSAVFNPALTTIAQPFHEMGRKSMELLLKIINEEPLKNEKFTIESQLMIRDSCGGRKK